MERTSLYFFCCESKQDIQQTFTECRLWARTWAWAHGLEEGILGSSINQETPEDADHSQVNPYTALTIGRASLGYLVYLSSAFTVDPDWQQNRLGGFLSKCRSP